MFDQSLWFAARGAGIVSLLLSTAVVCLGLLTAMRWQRPGWPKFLTVALHRQVALLSVVFVAVHVAAAVFDPFASLGVVAALVPLASSYRPIPVALGVVSLYLLTAVIVTSLLRDRIGRRVWRAVHWAAYAAWPLAVVHSLYAGSDAFATWMIAIVAGCVGSVLIALALRIQSGGSVRATLPDVVATPSGSPARADAGRTPEAGR
jgi:predicted ferric reductase